MSTELVSSSCRITRTLTSVIYAIRCNIHRTIRSVTLAWVPPTIPRSSSWRRTNNTTYSESNPRSRKEMVLTSLFLVFWVTWSIWLVLFFAHQGLKAPGGPLRDLTWCVRLETFIKSIQRITGWQINVTTDTGSMTEAISGHLESAVRGAEE